MLFDHSECLAYLFHFSNLHVKLRQAILRRKVELETPFETNCMTNSGHSFFTASRIQFWKKNSSALGN